MSKVSKTARASAVSSTKEVKKLSDAELLAQYRSERAAGLWPALPKSDAVLRLYDILLTESAAQGQLLETVKTESAELRGEVSELKRQLTLAHSTIDTLKKAQADMATVLGVEVPKIPYIPTEHKEHGLTGTQGKDSIGG